jgi:hypothetical protein
MLHASEQRAAIMLTNLGFDLRRIHREKGKHCDFYGKDNIGQDTIIEVKSDHEFASSQVEELLEAASSGTSVYLVIAGSKLGLFKLIAVKDQGILNPNTVI